MTLPKPEYLSLAEAVEYVASCCKVPDDQARQALLDAMRRGVIPVYGVHGNDVLGETHGKIPRELLHIAEVTWENGHLSPRSKLCPTVWEQYKNVELPSSEIHGWLASEEPKSEHKRGGGRRRKWDWDGAMLEAAKYVHDNGIDSDTNKPLVEHLSIWLFEERGDPDAVPDMSDIYKRIVTPLTKKFRRDE